MNIFCSWTLSGHREINSNLDGLNGRYHLSTRGINMEAGEFYLRQGFPDLKYECIFVWKSEYAFVITNKNPVPWIIIKSDWKYLVKAPKIVIRYGYKFKEHGEMKVHTSLFDSEYGCIQHFKLFETPYKEYIGTFKVEVEL